MNLVLYKDGVEVYHSSVGVRIVEGNETLNDTKFLALKRELGNCKKVSFCYSKKYEKNFLIFPTKIKFDFFLEFSIFYFIVLGPNVGECGIWR